MVLVLAGCGEQAANGSTGSQDARNAFLAERSGTPGVNASGTPIPGGQGGRAPGIFGTVTKIDGDKITVKSQIDGTESVVQLASGGTINKQAAAQASDIKEGETVTAVGTKNGDTIEAQTVEIGNGGLGGGVFFGGGGGGGGFGRFNGTPGPNGGRAFPSGTPPAGFGNGQGGGGRRFTGGNGQGGPNASGTPGTGRDFVSGKVAKVDGDTVTVTADTGTTETFKIGANTRLQKQVEIQVSDIKEGNALVAQGQKNGDIFQATSIQILDALPGRTPVPQS